MFAKLFVKYITFDSPYNKIYSNKLLYILFVTTTLLLT